MFSIDHFAMVDLDKPIQTETVGGVLSTFDNAANKFRTQLCRGGSRLGLVECTAVGYFTGEDGVTHRIGGVFEGTTEFTITLPMRVLTKAGRFTLVIKIGQGQQETTVRVIHGVVQKAMDEDLWKDIEDVYIEQTAANKLTITIRPYVDVQHYYIYEAVNGEFDDSIMNMKSLLNGNLTATITASAGEHEYFIIPALPDKDGKLQRGNVCGPYGWYVNPDWTA